MTASSELALTGEVSPIRFPGYNVLKTQVLEKTERVRREHKDPWLSFDHVSGGQWEHILRRRDELGRGVRLAYFADISIMIIKVPSYAHEAATQSLAFMIHEMVLRMRLRRREFYPLATATYRGGSNSSKQGDAVFKNTILRPGEDSWPHLVIEAGVSESLARLKADAKWWIESSQGNVNIVIIIHINVAAKHVQIEKYTPQKPSRTLRSGSNWVARRKWEISIDASVTPAVIQNAPLILEFTKVFGRARRSAQESDIILNYAELSEWATDLFIPFTHAGASSGSPP